jgi:hypothetical protein
MHGRQCDKGNFPSSYVRPLITLASQHATTISLDSSLRRAERMKAEIPFPICKLFHLWLEPTNIDLWNLYCFLFWPGIELYLVCFTVWENAEMSENYKGEGTRSPILHVCYSFRQKCSILDTVANKGLKNQKRE